MVNHLTIANLRQVFLAYFLVFFAQSVLANNVLNDDFVIQKLNEFEAAYTSRDVSFFEKNMWDDATITIHVREMDNKIAIKYTKKEVIDGDWFASSPQILDKLERKWQEIEYYNDNSQALLKYKLGVRKGSGFQEDRGYSIETEMLFQLKQGEPKIVNIISHINTAPELEAKLKGKQ